MQALTCKTTDAMCIAFLSLGHPDWPVLVAANRDEFHQRATAAAAPWPGHPHVYAGRDLQAGGTWLGCTREGRFALLTNYREPQARIPDGTPSRGILVRDYLLSDLPPERYVHTLATDDTERAGFNLIVGTPGHWWYYSNRSAQNVPQPLCAGLHVLSNHLLNTPWPKAQRLRSTLGPLPAEQWVAHPERILAALHDTTAATTETLPRTGLDTELEQLLSSPFVISPEYGTRCSSVLALGADGSLLFCEQGYDAKGQAAERHDWRSSR